ncbi:MAG TPA: lipopolysaccharide transport periplasmic protein LptA [Rhodanobacteraceae bacterium]|nr:lipopolysaccharide transport periplasmic protein LptA [Rhodanobacteraceae bacterium]
MRHPKTIEFALLATLALAVCGNAWALKSDREAKIQVAADHQVANLQNNGQVILTGHVKLSQGSIVITGEKTVGYENQDGEWDRAVVTGVPATFRQKLDNGSMVDGSADAIEYLVAENTVILTGSANVVQQGRGEFHGAKLTYNTDTGRMVGEGGSGGQVHMVFQPKARSAEAAPTSAPATGKPASPAPASSTSSLRPMQTPASAATPGTP